jgi:anti-anti-sigma factor
MDRKRPVRAGSARLAGATHSDGGVSRRPAASNSRSEQSASSDLRHRRTEEATRVDLTGRHRGPPARRGAIADRPPGGAGVMHTLVLTGELDRTSAQTLEVAIEHLCATGAKGITLDLSKLTYIDASGVAVIAFRSRLCQRRGFDFALIQGPWFIRRAFEVAGVLDSLPFTDHPDSPSPRG